MTAVGDVFIDISVVLGQSTMPINQLLKMGRGAVIELDGKEDQPVMILANGRPIARGEIVISGDRIAVSVTELLIGRPR
ncbi:flagellar motor switch protein FliN [Oleomonas cavernae]|uniref:Flagellar motor switch protein FliN n=1 Tax=Oleomonas cavernae TaxID=2320859 RepID=A0A418WTS0_9PROT|nr:FliM/FliN family flagellar motor switch protein [Oleomonas cavernae]RJF94661.1 flagellar motor switch protein FliN [Oleomonas cavernae]